MVYSATELRAGDWLRLNLPLVEDFLADEIVDLPSGMLLRFLAPHEGRVFVGEYLHPARGERRERYFVVGMVDRAEPTIEEEYAWCLARLAPST